MKITPILHYRESGKGPVVVLLHGYMASSRYWDSVISHLKQNHRVIAIDLLGFGESPKPRWSKYDYTAQHESINATLQSIGITEPFALAGHSMGSLIALRYAKNHPKSVSRLILTNMPLLLDESDAKKEIYGTNLLYRIGLTPGLHTVIWPLFKTLVSLRVLSSKIAEGATDRREYIFQSTGISRLRSMRNVIIAAKIRADLQAIEVTTTLINGVSDRKRYFQNLKHLPETAHIKIDNVIGGHHLPLTMPELVTATIAR